MSDTPLGDALPIDASGGDLLDEHELAAWRGMLRLVLRTRAELDRRLRAEHDLTIAEYDVLAPLAERPDGRLRMTELSAVVLQPPSSLTRIVGALERRGALRREDCADDRRGVEAVLTPEGRSQHARAQASHHRSVRELALHGLDTDRLDALADAWRIVGGASRTPQEG